MSTAACGLGFLHLFTWIKDGILNQSKGEGMAADGEGVGGFYSARLCNIRLHWETTKL